TKSRILTERGEAAAAKTLIDESLPSASEAEVNTYGYQLLGAGNAADAVGIFRENVRRHPESWNVYDSLGEGLAAQGQKAEAIANYRKALAMAPDAQKARIEGILAGLEK
ncbi:MAG: tetratricopeptide repeat protein, partial [Acidobacteria bacterium]|nr:tetratricopeptide repeat protein [Acidobacteriota bacterium]